jgi:hypothetical protein
VTRESEPSGFAVVAASTLVIAVAGLAARLVVTGNYRTYVKPTMAPFLILTAGFLFVLGTWSLVSQHRLHRARQAPQGQSGHVPQVAWLLVLPVVIVCFLAPSSLGAFTAKRSPDIPPGPVGKVYFPPLPKGDPERVPLSAYTERAAYGGESALEGRHFVFVASSPTLRSHGRGGI